MGWVGGSPESRYRYQRTSAHLNVMNTLFVRRTGVQGGGGVGDFMVTISLFQQQNWLHACVYHDRMKPKVGRNFTSERGEEVKGEVKNISLH